MFKAWTKATNRRLGMGINSDTLTNRPPFSDDTLLYIALS